MPPSPKAFKKDDRVRFRTERDDPMFSIRGQVVCMDKIVSAYVRFDGQQEAEKKYASALEEEKKDACYDY